MRPHVFLLGAGASRQAFPNGDARGRQLPVMNELPGVPEIREVLERWGQSETGDDFEALYCRLYEADARSPVVGELEAATRRYFESLRLPASPTLYDHLLLSLRPKDIVATFNWDPLLFDARERNERRASMPEVVYLHGNVRVGYCAKHRVQGHYRRSCPECDQPLTASPLLFPIRNKDYTSDPFIEQAWEQLRKCMRVAFVLTIFGYGAPNTDRGAVDLLHSAWSEAGERKFEETEFIDILPEAELYMRWRDFTYSHHFRCFADFYDSWAPNHPRRSCEAMAGPIFDGRFAESCPIHRGGTLEALAGWLSPILDAERKVGVDDWLGRQS